jgi:tRNA nucleotidyltransferase (CCA-adding enzyme)
MTLGPIDLEVIPEAVRSLCARLQGSGYRAWLVGGGVRDILRGVGAKDWDIASDATPEQVRAAFPKVIPTGIEHGTVTVLWSGEAFEVTTLRGEGEYTDGRRPDNVYFVTEIQKDLARRDFTVNAIACVPDTGEIIDPFGGASDLELKCIRAVGDPLERFREDGLRVLRAARFCASLEFELDAATERAIAQTLEVFAKVSAERVREEWMKALRSREPSRAVWAMHRTGILQVTFPELAEDVELLGRNATAMDLYEGTECERLALLFTEVGSAGLAGQSSEVVAAHAADLSETWMREYRFSNAERRATSHLIRHAPAPQSLVPGHAASFRRFASIVGPAAARVVLEFEAARADASEDAEALRRAMHLREELDAVLLEDPPLSVGDLAVRGGEIIEHCGIAGGAWVKGALGAILTQVIEDPSQNERETLLRAVDEWRAAEREGAS